MPPGPGYVRGSSSSLGGQPAANTGEAERGYVGCLWGPGLVPALRLSSCLHPDVWPVASVSWDGGARLRIQLWTWAAYLTFCFQS